MPGISLSVSDDARDGWNYFAAEQGSSLAALLEVLGRHLVDDPFRPEALELIGREARTLTAERRRAGGPRKKR